MIANADIVMTPSLNRNHEKRYILTSRNRPTSLIVSQICFHPNAMYRTILRAVPPRLVALARGGPGRGFNQNGTVGKKNAAHQAVARKIGTCNEIGLRIPMKYIDPSAQHCMMRAERYPHVRPREEINAARRFAFSVSSSSVARGVMRGVCSVVTDAEEEARDDSTGGGSTRISG